MSEMPTVGYIPTFTMGDRLRKAREHVGLEQGEFAERLGVSRGTVSNYERGSVAPRRIVLNAWAMATGIPVAWLRDGENPRPGEPDGGTVRHQGLEPRTR